jgi:hypothetical protein
MSGCRPRLRAWRSAAQLDKPRALLGGGTVSVTRIRLYGSELFGPTAVLETEGGAVVECVSEFTNPATFAVEDRSTRTVLLGASMTCPPGAGPTVDLPVASSSEVGLMCRQIAHEIRRRRVTLAGVAAIASLAFATWAFIPNAYSASDVENCDRTLGPAAPGVDFSGVFEGSIVEVGQSGSAAQAKFVRNGHSVRGSYLLGEICGGISGEVNSHGHSK